MRLYSLTNFFACAVASLRATTLRNNSSYSQPILYSEMHLDKNGNPCKFVRRGAGSELTFISERDSFGRWSTRTVLEE